MAIYTYIYLLVCGYIYIHITACVCGYIYIHISACVCGYIYIHIPACMCGYIYIHIPACVCGYIYIYIPTGVCGYIDISACVLLFPCNTIIFKTHLVSSYVGLLNRLSSWGTYVLWGLELSLNLLHL